MTGYVVWTMIAGERRKQEDVLSHTERLLIQAVGLFEERERVKAG